jgi:hypothetical protein
MESFMGQLILNDEIDYEAAKEHLEERIGGLFPIMFVIVVQKNTDNQTNGRKKICRRNYLWHYDTVILMISLNI